MRAEEVASFRTELFHRNQGSFACPLHDNAVAIGGQLMIEEGPELFLYDMQGNVKQRKKSIRCQSKIPHSHFILDLSPTHFAISCFLSRKIMFFSLNTQKCQILYSEPDKAYGPAHMCHGPNKTIIACNCFAKARSEPERNEDLNIVYVCVCVY